MKSIREAIDLMLPHFAPVGVEQVALLSALGKPLASDVIARADLPGFDNSAMDGYAVRHADLSPAPCTLPLAGETRAGAGPSTLPAGHAQRIFTGALMPDGADTVVMQENTQPQPHAVRIDALPRAGEHVRKRGSDLRAGQLALPAGSVLGPGEVALLASQSLAEVGVQRAPRVAILCTGDEVRELGQALAPGQLVNSNAYALCAHVQEAGAQPWLLPTARDDADDLRDKLALGLRADVLLTTGGVSVGDHDLVAPALRALGIEPLFWKVAMKPGKPLLFAVHAQVPIVGLPGNPASAFVGFELFVRPGLRRMLGHRALHRAALQVTLEHDVRRNTGRVELARATLVRTPSGVRARLHARQGSGALPSLAGIDALVILPAERGELRAGEPVNALSLRADVGDEAPAFT